MTAIPVDDRGIWGAILEEPQTPTATTDSEERPHDPRWRLREARHCVRIVKGMLEGEFERWILASNRCKRRDIITTAQSTQSVNDMLLARTLRLIDEGKIAEARAQSFVLATNDMPVTLTFDGCFADRPRMRDIRQPPKERQKRCRRAYLRALRHLLEAGKLLCQM